MKVQVLCAAAVLALTACDGGGDKKAPVEAGVEREAGTPSAEAYTPWDPSRADIQTTESGLQYIVVRAHEGDSAKPASPRDTVSVMYEGRIAATGEKFDSSYDRGSPASFPLNGVIKGWTEGLQLMSVGDEFVFFIPAELGYGDSPRPGGVIKPGDDLVFSVELQDVRFAPPPKVADVEAWSTYVPWDSAREDIVKTGTGLEYVVLASGDAEGATPTVGDPVVLHYEGRLNETGETFDSSFPAGQAAVFPRAGGLIPGFSEALQRMRPGDRWLIYIPSRIGYGENGTPGGPIPPYADLVFEVELLDVLDRR